MKPASGLARTAKLFNRRLCGFVYFSTRFIHDRVGASGGVEKIKNDTSLFLLVGPAALEPATRPL
jgi:hypothetical protein